VQEVLYEKEDGRKSICITLRLFHWLCSRLVGIRKIAGRMQVDSFAALYHMDIFKRQHDEGYKKLGGRGASDVTDTRDYQCYQKDVS